MDKKSVFRGELLYDADGGHDTQIDKKSFSRGLLLGSSCCLLLVLIFGFVLVFTGRVSVPSAGNSGASEELKKKVERKAKVLESYIDTYFLDEINEEKMADSVYKGIIDGLGDEYAAYYNKEEYQQIQESTSGVFCGIGAYISADTDTGIVSIVKPMKNSPAEKAGVKAGDIIFAVDGKEVTGMEISQVQAMVKGERGTKVKLSLVRDKEQKEVEVTRDEIEEDTVAYRMLPGKIGYVQVSGFEQVTPAQYEKAMKALEKKGQKGMIIDLRDNGGGLLDAAVDMLDRILPKGVVVYSKDKDGNKQEFFAEEDDTFQKPLVILVNENSASASEVFSGAIQDEKAGILMGTQTFGKGIVQSMFDLGDDTGLKMTTAKYYTPKGRNIHGKGLTPDKKVDLTEEISTLSDGKTKVDSQMKAAHDYLIDECK